MGAQGRYRTRVRQERFPGCTLKEALQVDSEGFLKFYTPGAFLASPYSSPICQIALYELKIIAKSQALPGMTTDF